MKNLISMFIIGIIIFLFLYSANYSTNILLTGSKQEIIITLLSTTTIATMSGYTLYKFSKKK